MSLAPINQLNPPVNISLTVPRRCFFCGSFLFAMLHVSVCCDALSVPCSPVVTCWKRADLSAVICVVFFVLCHFPKCVLVHVRFKGEVGAAKLVKSSSKIFYRPFQGGTSFVDLLCFCSVLCLLCLCARLFICALWSPSGKGLTSWLSFVVSAVILSLSHWYPGSGVVLDCIDS